MGQRQGCCQGFEHNAIFETLVRLSCVGPIDPYSRSWWVGSKKQGERKSIVVFPVSGYTVIGTYGPCLGLDAFPGGVAR